jgi:hypothetical protein
MITIIFQQLSKNRLILSSVEVNFLSIFNIFSIMIKATISFSSYVFLLMFFNIS